MSRLARVLSTTVEKGVYVVSLRRVALHRFMQYSIRVLLLPVKLTNESRQELLRQLFALSVRRFAFAPFMMLQLVIRVLRFAFLSMILCRLLTMSLYVLDETVRRFRF